MQQDSDLGKGYAQKLVTNSKGVGTLFGLVGSGKYIKQAVALDPKVAYQGGAAYCFKKHIKESQWQAAFDLLSKHRGEGLADTELSVDGRRALADHFIAEGNSLHKAARLAPATDYSSKEGKYFESLAMIALAVEVISEDKYLHQLHLHQRLCAQTMMDSDKHRGGCTLERIELALHYIHAIEMTPCSLTDPHLTDTHIKILEEKIQLLHQLCLSPNTYESGTTAEPEHKLQCQNELQQLMETLDMSMMLWSKVSNKEDAKNRSRLAAVHFLKAECIQYFELTGNAKEHFHQACRLEQKNPYYHLRHAECYVDISKQLYDEESNKGLVLLQKHGVTANDYMRWFDDRWLLNKTSSAPSFCL